jgi:hypothetical protein
MREGGSSWLVSVSTLYSLKLHRFIGQERKEMLQTKRQADYRTNRQTMDNVTPRAAHHSETI